MGKRKRKTRDDEDEEEGDVEEEEVVAEEDEGEVEEEEGEVDERFVGQREKKGKTSLEKEKESEARFSSLFLLSPFHSSRDPRIFADELFVPDLPYSHRIFSCLSIRLISIYISESNRYLRPSIDLTRMRTRRGRAGTLNDRAPHSRA